MILWLRDVIWMEPGEKVYNYELEGMALPVAAGHHV